MMGQLPYWSKKHKSGSSNPFRPIKDVRMIYCESVRARRTRAPADGPRGEKGGAHVPGNGKRAEWSPKEQALKAHPAPGARPRLFAEQHAPIPAMLAKVVSAAGCVGEIWNSRRRAVAIKPECGVSSSPDHCEYLARTMGKSRAETYRAGHPTPGKSFGGGKNAAVAQAQKKPHKKSARESLSTKQACLCCR